MGQGNGRGFVVERGHDLDGLGEPVLADLSPLERGSEDPGAQRLGEKQHVSGLAAGVGQHAVGMGFTDDREAEFGLRIVDRMPTHRGAGGEVEDFRSSFQYLAQQLERKLFAGPAHQVEREKRLPPMA